MTHDDFDYPDDYVPLEDESREPVGSCEWCGTNLYEDDDDELCDQCLWHVMPDSGDDDIGMQPVV